MIFLQATPSPSQDALSVFDLLLKGGVILIPIALLLIFSLYLFVERLLAYRSMAKYDRRLPEHVKADLAGGELKQAISLCETQDGAMPMIYHAGLRTLSTGGTLDEIEKSMESMANILFSRLSNPLSFLGLISGIAPMLGFVGTILGVIRIFFDIHKNNNIDIGIIAEGLYEKMITSFAGLIVGIIAFSAYHILQYFIDKFALQVETEVFDFLTFLKQPKK